jgi:hypothetical protein
MHISRRLLWVLLASKVELPMSAAPRLGDQEWMRRFRIFIRAFNEFVDALDDNKIDRASWARMCRAWDSLQTDH